VASTLCSLVFDRCYMTDRLLRYRRRRAI
jgi:hypothetical protein